MPDATGTYHLLTTLLHERFQVPADRMNDHTTFQELELDSIAVIEVFVVLSEQLGIDVDDSLARPATTLSQAAAILADGAAGPR